MECKSRLVRMHTSAAVSPQSYPANEEHSPIRKYTSASDS